MNRICRTVLILLIVIFTVSVSGCRRKDGAVQEKKPADSTVSDRSSSSGRQKLVFGTLKKESGQNDKKKEPVTDLDPGDYSAVLASLFSPAVIPSDTIIGELQDPDVLQPDAVLLYRNIVMLFKKLAEKEIPENLLSPVNRSIISAGLKKYELPEDTKVRIGVFRYTDNYAEMAVRLISDKGRASGSLMAENIEGVWMISDISVDLGLLNREYEFSDKKFEPDSYANLNLEY